MFSSAISSAAQPSFGFNKLKLYDVYLSFYVPDSKCKWFASRLCSALDAAGIFTSLERKFTDDRPSYQRKLENLTIDIIGAVEKVSCTCGWSGDQYKIKESTDTSSRLFKENALISDVVRDVVKISETYKIHLDAANCFGLDWGVEHIRGLLNMTDLQKKTVKVGIHGMAGMDKTTLAKVVCKSIFYSQFEAYCFALGVGERCQQENGLLKLQIHILKEVSRFIPKENFRFSREVGHIDQGKHLLQECLMGKRVLPLLDDIQSAEQLEALGGNFRDFGLGSRLLITSQIQQILKLANVDEMYEVRRLPQEHAMELFKFHAFPESHCPDPDLQTLSINIVNACEGHPLALQLLGKSLLGENDRNVWKDMAEKLRDDPYIQKKLRASYDTLDAHEKEMFLDVACFFAGQDKDIAMVWADLKWNCHASLAHLFQKSLANVGPRNELLMHRCLRDLGATVANEVSTDPHKRTRLFAKDDVHHVLHRPWEKARTVRYLRYEPKERKTTKAGMFLELYNLRLVWLANVEACYFDELRWLRLMRCSLTRLPPGMNLNKLVLLEVTDTHITHLWDEKTEEEPHVWPEKLKVLILKGCKFLEKLPATIIYTQLQILDLHSCHSLRSLPNAVGNFHSLVNLNMKGCGVSCLPEEFGKLSSLQELDLSWCKNLRNLPPSFGNLTRLERLEIHHNSNLIELPATMGGLKSLSISGCQLLHTIREWTPCRNIRIVFVKNHSSGA